MINKSLTDNERFSEYFKFRENEEQPQQNNFDYYFDIGYRYKSEQNSSYLLTNKFIEVIDSGFRKCIKVANYALAYSYIQVLLNWNSHVNQLTKVENNHRYIFKTLFNSNTNQIFYFLIDAYQNKDTAEDSIRRQLLYRSLLTLLFNEKHPINDEETIDELFGRLFDHLKLALQKGAEDDYESFIQDIISGNYFPFGSNSFVENLYRFSVQKKLDLKEEIRQLNTRLPSLLFASDYQQLSELVSSALEKIRPQLTVEEFEVFSGDASEFLVKNYNNYKGSRLKITVFQTLAYAIFRKQYQLVEDAFKKHTPDDANAHFGNHDMVSFHLLSCLILIRKQDSLEHEVTFKWDGHHGADIYLSVMNVFYLAKAIVMSRNNEMNALYNHLEQLDSGQLEWLKSRFGYLKGPTLRFMQAKKITLLYLSEDRLVKFLEDGEKAIDVKLAEKAAWQKLIGNVSEIFAEAATEDFERMVFFRNVLDSYDLASSEDNQLNIEVKTSFSEITIREQFIEGWHIGSSNVYGSFANELAKQEDYNTVEKLRQILKGGGNVAMDGIEALLNGISENSIIIAIGLHLYTQIYQSDSFMHRNTASDQKAERFITGTFKNIPIYEVYLPGLSTLIILNIGKISAHDVLPAKLVTTFIDINSESEKLAEQRPDLNADDYGNMVYMGADSTYTINYQADAGTIYQITNR